MDYQEGQLNLNQVVQWGKNQVPRGMSLCVPFSGGIDSAACLALSEKIVGPKKVIALHVGHTSSRPEETRSAKQVAKFLGIKLITADLARLCSLYRETAFNISNQVPGRKDHGIMSTQNASLIYTTAREIARQNQALVVGTLDLAECLTGFFPKESFSGDILPIGGLFRFEVRQLAAQLGLPPLPEAFAVVPGCGSISTYVNEVVGQTVVKNEKDLDQKLMRMIVKISSSNKSLNNWCRLVLHKTRVSHLGRPVYYPFPKRETRVRNWLKGGRYEFSV